MSSRTKTPSAQSRPADGPSRIHVVPTADGWQVRKEGAGKVIGAYATQSEAVQAAQFRLKRSGGELRIQGEDGRWKESFTLGGMAMAKLAAVEGITYTPAMKRKIRAAQDPSLTSDERRTLLAFGLRSGRR